METKVNGKRACQRGYQAATLARRRRQGEPLLTRTAADILGRDMGIIVIWVCPECRIPIDVDVTNNVGRTLLGTGITVPRSVLEKGLEAAVVAEGVDCEADVVTIGEP